MTVKTATGTIVSIGPQVTSATNDLSSFEALSYTAIGETEDLGEYGDASNDVTFQSLADGRIRHSKGARDAGVLALIVGSDPLDAGQAALEAAEGTNKEYAFKVEYPDAPTDDYSNTVEYFRALVQSKRRRTGTGDNVLRRMFNLGINSEIFTNPSQWIS